MLLLRVLCVLLLLRPLLALLLLPLLALLLLVMLPLLALLLMIIIRPPLVNRTPSKTPALAACPRNCYSFPI
jgi:hypothetical protein